MLAIVIKLLLTLTPYLNLIVLIISLEFTSMADLNHKLRFFTTVKDDILRIKQENGPKPLQMFRG